MRYMRILHNVERLGEGGRKEEKKEKAKEWLMSLPLEGGGCSLKGEEEEKEAEEGG